MSLFCMLPFFVEIVKQLKNKFRTNFVQENSFLPKLKTIVWNVLFVIMLFWSYDIFLFA